MAREEEQEVCIVTEVGTFGDLNIVDPTKKKVRKMDDLEEIIREATEENSRNLTGR